MPKTLLNERRAVGHVEVRGLDEEKRQFTARVVNYNVVDSYGSVWAPGVFTRSLERKMPKVTWGHDWLDPIGVVTSFDERADGLDLTVQLDDFDAVPRARQAFAQLKSGSMDEFSFGFKREAWSEKREDLAPFGDGARELMTEARMDEMSPVLVGAVPGTHTIDVRSASASALDLLTEVREGRMTVEDGVRALTQIAPDPAAADSPTGAMVALVPDTATAAYLSKLAKGGLGAGDLHCTLVYMGDAAGIDEVERTHVIGAITSWAAQTAPVEVAVAGTAYLGPDSMRVVLVESAGLVGCFMDAAEIAPAGEHHATFIPHVSLSASGPLPMPDVSQVLVFDKVLVAFAGDRVEVDLVGHPGAELDSAELDAEIADALDIYYDMGW